MLCYCSKIPEAGPFLKGRGSFWLTILEAQKHGGGAGVWWPPHGKHSGSTGNNDRSHRMKEEVRGWCPGSLSCNYFFLPTRTHSLKPALIPSRTWSASSHFHWVPPLKGSTIFTKKSLHCRLSFQHLDLWERNHSQTITSGNVIGGTTVHPTHPTGSPDAYHSQHWS